MSSLSTRLSNAIAGGRRRRWRPGSREEVLARLLVKRAEARQAGLDRLEASLRQQIAWALPVRRGDGAGPEEDWAGEDRDGRDAEPR